MQKLVCLIFLWSFLITKMYSQSILGKVIDSTQSPVSFATVALLHKSDSSIEKGMMTDENGTYVFSKIKHGAYLLKITAFGFNDSYSSVELRDSMENVQMPEIQLDSKRIDLNEVSVTSIKKVIEFKNGNIIVNVENSPLAKGNTVYDLLYKLPGVSMDGNTITLQGRSGVTLLIDGRPQQLTTQQLMNVLKSMSAELVEKIEILKNPPVKYDASGTSGMIHIKTKKAKTVGFSGSANTSASQGFYARSMTGVALNYKTQKFSFFSNANYNDSYYQVGEKFTKKFISGSGVTAFNGINTLKDLERGVSFKLGTDWFASKKNIIGCKIEGGPGSYISNGNGMNTILGYNNMGFDHISSNTSTQDAWNTMNYNINEEHQFDTSGTVLNFSSDYTTITEVYKGYNENYFLAANNSEVLQPNIYRSTNHAASGILASKLDFTRHINQTSSFEAGLKGSFINTSNNYLFERKNDSANNFYTDAVLTNKYNYSEKTLAAYGNYVKTYKKLNFQLGVRAENTNLVGKNTSKNFELKRNYFNMFPNISCEYERSANTNFQLTINRRIDRPQYDNLTPFTYYRDQYSYVVGNPFLLPHFSNSIEVTHSYKKILTNTFSYTRINNVMVPYTIQNDTTKVTTETIKNMKYSDAYTYTFFLQQQVQTWWELSLNGVLSYLDYKGDIQGVPFKTGGLYYNGYFTNTLLFSKSTKLEITGFYRGPKYTGITEVKSRWMLSLALKRTFFKEKIDCTVGINDIFYTLIGKSSVNFANQNWNYAQTSDTRRVIVSLNYNFGKIKVIERQTQSNEQEKERLNH